ncbi:MAG TPA: HDIG domain-containing protein [Thermoanaerobaculia bacterium]|nr:HDIG domain-containing protein [Thermoanaerobaculia bacterium]
MPKPKPRPAPFDPDASGAYLLMRPPLGRRVADLAGGLWQRALEAPALWTVLFLLAGGWALLPAGFLTAPKVAAGAIAPRDYVASRDLLLPDEATTREKQERARQAVLPVYDLDLAVARERGLQIERLFTRGRGLLARAGEEAAGRASALAELQRELREGTPPAVAGLEVGDEPLALLAAKGFRRPLEERLTGLFTKAQRRGIAANKGLLLEHRLRGVTLRNPETGAGQKHFDLFDHLGYPDETRAFLEDDLRDWPDLTRRERGIIVDLALANLKPNLDFNHSESLARQEAAVAAVAPVFTQVRKGQVIARTGDQVTPAQARAIAQLVGDRRARQFVPTLLGTLLLLALAAGAVWLGLRHERLPHHDRPRLFGEALLLLLVAILGTKLHLVLAGALARSFDAPPLDSLRSYTYAVPFAATALLAALLFGRQAALVIGLVYAALAGRLAEAEPWLVFYALGGSLAAVYAVERHQFKHRAALLRVGLWVGLANVAMVLILYGFSGGAERGLLHAVFDLLMGFGGGILVAAVASFALPALEGALGITTDIKLVELSNTNLPLLRRLAFEAPGTFQHSLMVANLAKEGCEAIGADAVLAYAGALYHDVGKVFRPDYFIENQRPGQNPHDKLAPSMSAFILVSHVKDGVALARQHKLPQLLVDAIEQHHGTRLIKYFYNRAQELAGPESGEVTMEAYRYPGPRPQGREMGVLMLADAVEAASRTLAEPTTAKLRALIRTLLDDCLDDRQLDETALTLADLTRVAEAFERVLSTIFHQRIDYPGFDFNARVPRRPVPAARAS